MRVMMLIKADPDPGASPSEELLTEMGGPFPDPSR
jgi:hypothetical protein